MTPYEILSVDPKDVHRHRKIKTNYRLLSLKHHPDKGGRTEAFHAIQEAYELIGDTANRIRYDHATDYRGKTQTIDMMPLLVNLGYFQDGVPAARPPQPMVASLSDRIAATQMANHMALPALAGAGK